MVYVLGRRARGVLYETLQVQAEGSRRRVGAAIAAADAAELEAIRRRGGPIGVAVNEEGGGGGALGSPTSASSEAVNFGASTSSAPLRQPTVAPRPSSPSLPPLSAMPAWEQGCSSTLFKTMLARAFTRACTAMGAPPPVIDHVLDTGVVVEVAWPELGLGVFISDVSDHLAVPSGRQVELIERAIREWESGGGSGGAGGDGFTPIEDLSTKLGGKKNEQGRDGDAARGHEAVAFVLNSLQLQAHPTPSASPPIISTISTDGEGGGGVGSCGAGNVNSAAAVRAAALGLPFVYIPPDGAAYITAVAVEDGLTLGTLGERPLARRAKFDCTRLRVTEWAHLLRVREGYQRERAAQLLAQYKLFKLGLVKAADWARRGDRGGRRGRGSSDGEQPLA